MKKTNEFNDLVLDAALKLLDVLLEDDENLENQCGYLCLFIEEVKDKFRGHQKFQVACSFLMDELEKLRTVKKDEHSLDNWFENNEERFIIIQSFIMGFYL